MNSRRIGMMSGLLMFCSFLLPWIDDWSDLDYWSDNGFAVFYDLPFFFFFPAIGGIVFTLHMLNMNPKIARILSVVGGFISMTIMLSFIYARRVDEVSIFMIELLGPYLMLLGSLGVFVTGVFGYKAK